MRYFPMFLDMRTREALLVGGGEQIAQKARLLLRTEARLTVMAPQLNPEMAALAEAGRLRHIAVAFDPDAVAAADFIFVGVDDAALQTRIVDAARAGRALVNMIDKPEASDMITPAIVDRDPVVVAIGTEGAAPVLARRIKSELEVSLSPRLGGFVARLAGLRADISSRIAWDRRLAFWRWVVFGAPWRLWDKGDEAGAENALRMALAAGDAPPAPETGVTVIAAPPAPDLLPLRALRRMQEAELILHAADADPALLDLARRDAARSALPACPRSAMATLSEAIAGVEGGVVIIAPAQCAAADWDQVDEAIGFAPA